MQFGQGSNLFGGTPSAGFSFGSSSSSSTSTSNPPSTPSLGATTPSFGTTNPSAAPSFGATTPSFGTTNPPTPSFGSTNTSTPSFGSTNPSTTLSFGTTNPSTTPSLGATNTPTLSFGTSNPSTTTTSLGATGGLFGTSSTPSLGGTSSSSSLFGSSSTPSFGGSSNTGIGTFGGSNIFGGTTTSNAPLQRTGIPPLDSIISAYDVNDSQYRFKHFFYNLVPPNEVQAFRKPSNVPDRLWEQALDANPDPRRLVPVLACGFGDLKKRIDEQQKMKKLHEEKIEEIKKCVSQLERRYDRVMGETTIKIEQFKQRHSDLSHRLLKVMKKIEVLRKRGVYAIGGKEEEFRAKLERIQRALNQPNHYKGKLNELVALVRMEKHRSFNQNIELDEESLQAIERYLSDQTKGLMQLIEIVKKDSKDLQIIQDGFAKPSETDQPL